MRDVAWLAPDGREMTDEAWNADFVRSLGMLLPGTAIEETTRQTARLEAAARALGSSGIYARVGKATDEEVLAGADPGTSATSPSSASKVVSSSWARYDARSSQRQRVQYSISTRGRRSVMGSLWPTRGTVAS